MNRVDLVHHHYSADNVRLNPVDEIQQLRSTFLSWCSDGRPPSSASIVCRSSVPTQPFPSLSLTIPPPGDVVSLHRSSPFFASHHSITPAMSSQSRDLRKPRHSSHNPALHLRCLRSSSQIMDPSRLFFVTWRTPPSPPVVPPATKELWLATDPTSTDDEKHQGPPRQLRDVFSDHHPYATSTSTTTDLLPPFHCDSLSPMNSCPTPTRSGLHRANRAPRLHHHQFSRPASCSSKELQEEVSSPSSRPLIADQ